MSTPKLFADLPTTPWPAIELTPEPIILIVSAPSGGGKDTLATELRREFAFEKVVTCTTRPPRPLKAGSPELEQDGIHYHFLTTKEFQRRIDAGDFLEYASVAGGHFYGTLRSSVFRPIEAGKSVLLLIDVQGHGRVRSCGDAQILDRLISVFVFPPSLEILADRLRKRAVDGPDAIERRLADARGEISRAGEFDLSVLNLIVPRALKDLENGIRNHWFRKRSMRLAGNGNEQGPPLHLLRHRVYQRVGQRWWGQAHGQFSHRA